MRTYADLADILEMEIDHERVTSRLARADFIETVQSMPDNKAKIGQLKLIALERIETAPPVGTTEYLTYALYTNALLGLLKEYGVKPSAKVDLMFSPAASPER